MTDHIEWTPADLQTAISDAISDSLDMDWGSEDGAKAVMGLPIISEIPAMVEALRAVATWEEKVNDLEDDFEYLNREDGWSCLEQIAEKVRAILARIDGANQ